MILWRISNYDDLSGAGGVIHAGRWHSRGRPVVYLAESAAGALLEVLVHIEAKHPGELPCDYRLLEVAVPDEAGIEDIETESAVLPGGWQTDLSVTRRLGDRWLASGSSLLLRVPSAVVGRTYNLLFNPLHAQAARCTTVSVVRYPFDQRLR